MFDFIKKGAVKLRSLFFLIIFPKRCLSCGAFDSYFCFACQEKMKFLLSSESKKNLLIYSIFSYKEQGMAALIHSFKYAGLEEVFIELENFLLKKKKYLEEKIKFNISGDVYYFPVVLHKKRLRERGYNQSGKLAMIFQKIWSGKILQNLVIRHKYSKAQANLNRVERLQNLKNKFILADFEFSEINKNDLLVIVDDVLTTGATLMENYKILKNKWPGRIVGLTLAKD